MSNRFWKKITLAAALVVAAGVLGSMGLTAAGAADKEDKPIVQYMKKINDTYKTLVKQAKKGEFNDESIKMTVEMQELALKAMHEPPPMAEKADKVPADKKAKFITDYKKAMADTIHDMLLLEVALEEGNKEEAKTLVAKLTTDKKSGHDKFVEE